mgnify:CR=1 FL=1
MQEWTFSFYWFVYALTAVLSKDGKVSDSVPEQEPATNSQENQPQVGEQPEESGQPEEHPRKVYLTFDDGPSENTAKILDILKERNIKATFFVTG